MSKIPFTIRILITFGIFVLMVVNLTLVILSVVQENANWIYGLIGIIILILAFLVFIPKEPGSVYEAKRLGQQTSINLNTKMKDIDVNSYMHKTDYGYENDKEDGIFLDEEDDYWDDEDEWDDEDDWHSSRDDEIEPEYDDEEDKEYEENMYLNDFDGD